MKRDDRNRYRRNKGTLARYLDKHGPADDGIFYDPGGNYERRDAQIIYCGVPWGIAGNVEMARLMVAGLNRDEKLHGQEKE